MPAEKEKSATRRTAFFSCRRIVFLVYDFPGATFTSVNGINRANMMCGRYTDPSTGIDHGIIVQLVRTAAGAVTLPLAPPSAPAPTVPQRPVEVAPAYQSWFKLKVVAESAAATALHPPGAGSLPLRAVR